MGSIPNPRRWIVVLQASGTTSVAFAQFLNHICTDIEQNGTHLRGYVNYLNRFFMWDNFVSHITPLVAQTIEARNGPCHFGSVNRPPYQPKYGAIEYKILDLITEVSQHVEPDWTTQQLEQGIYEASARIGPFNSTFDHVLIR